MSIAIYALSDPNTGIVHYIGISRNVQRRYREHCRCSGLNLQKNTWIQELLQKHQHPALTVIESVKDLNTAREREKIWIHTYLELGLPLTNSNGNEQSRNGGERIDDPALDRVITDEITRSQQIKEARRLIQEWSNPTPANHHNKGWLGIAPSYLATELDVEYDDACDILLELQAQGFIYDNDNGNSHRLDDGRICATRFYMTVQRYRKMDGES